jgi:hypothetical protein
MCTREIHTQQILELTYTYKTLLHKKILELTCTYETLLHNKLLNSHASTRYYKTKCV